MIIRASALRINDQLREGTRVTSLSRSQGHTYAKLDDGRRLIAPDHYLLWVAERPRSPDDRIEGPQSAIEAIQA